MKQHKPRFDIFSLSKAEPQPVSDILPLALEVIRRAATDIEDNCGHPRFPVPAWIKNLMNRLMTDSSPLSQSEFEQYFRLIELHNPGMTFDGATNSDKLYSAIKQYFGVK